MGLLSLAFMGKSEPELVQVQFWAGKDTKGKATSTMVNREGICEPDSEEFNWTVGVRAFCVLLLRAYAEGKPASYRMAGTTGSLAQSLAEVATAKSARGGGKTWIQKIFSSKEQQNPPRISPEWVTAKINYSKRFFSVRLPSRWSEIRLKVSIGKQILTEKDMAQLATVLAPPQETVEFPPSEPLTADLSLSVFNSRNGQITPLRVCSLPIKTDYGIIIRADLSRPAYPYIVWIDSLGEIQPLYPWWTLDWETRSIPEKIQNLALPEARTGEQPGYYPIGGHPGVEIALLLVNDQPLTGPESLTLRTLIRKVTRCHPKLGLCNPAEAVEFSFGPNTQLPRKRLGPPQLIRNPFSSFQKDLTAVLCERFTLMKGLAFCTERAAVENSKSKAL